MDGKIQAILLTVFGLVIMGVAIALASSSKKAQYKDTARTSVNVFASIVLVAVGMGAIGYAAFGSKILNTFGVTDAPKPAATATK